MLMLVPTLLNRRLIPPDIKLTTAVAKTNAPTTAKSASLPGKPRTQAGSSSMKIVQPKTQPNTPKKKTALSQASSSGGPTPQLAPSGLQTDLAGLHLTEEVDESEREREQEKYKERVGLNMKQEELVSKVKRDEEESGKKGVSLIVVGEWNMSHEARPS
jgi:elongation factor 1 alpha-like protein